MADAGIVLKSNRKSYRVTAPLEMSGFRVRHLFLCIHTVFSNAGDVRFWDPRFTESVRTLNLQQGLTAVDIHKHADVLSW